MPQLKILHTIEGTYLNIIKAIDDKPTENTSLKVKN